MDRRGPVPGPGGDAAVRARAAARPRSPASGSRGRTPRRRCRCPPAAPLEIVHSPLARTAETAQAVADAIAAAAAADGAGPSGALAVRPGARAPRDRPGRVGGRDPRRDQPPLAGRARRLASPALGDLGARRRVTRRRSRSGSARPWRAILERLGRDYPRGTLDRPQVGGYAGVGPQAGQPWSILVGHDGVFKVVMLTLFDLPLTHFWMFTMALTGITVVEFRGGRPVAPGREPHGAPGAAPRRARAGAGGPPREVRGAVGPGAPGQPGRRGVGPARARLSGAVGAAGGAGRA